MPGKLSSPRRQTILILIFLILVVFFMTMFRMGVVRGASMQTTYQDGQVVLVRRKNWFSAPLKHNDVVLLKQNRDVIIKRVYKLPGEEITSGYPFVLESTRRYGLTDYYDQRVEQTPQGPQTHLYVPKGYIVILGDNLKVSEDSRLFGPVPEKDILGTVVNSPGPPDRTPDQPPAGWNPADTGQGEPSPFRRRLPDPTNPMPAPER